MKKIFYIVFITFFISINVFSQESSLKAANRRTAVRCLKLAQDFLSAKDWTNAISQAELGLAYDDSIADLWYIKAAASSSLGSPRYKVLPLVSYSLSNGQWVDYNRDAARILFADLLCNTGKYTEALNVLDSKPFIYSADSEFIRAKSYYGLKTEESITKARDKINTARKIYSSDTRFARLFFSREFALRKKRILINPQSEFTVERIANSFIAKMPEYDNSDAELEIYAAIFSPEDKRKRLLEAFSSRGLKHPLYAVSALACGLLSEYEAWDYFMNFAEKEVSLEFMEDILPLISEESAVTYVKESLNSFGGIITVDTDGDCTPNLYINYLRGRPQTFSWDKENDGVEEWAVECDFGSPLSVTVDSKNIKFIYGSYPYIISVIHNADAGQSVFTLHDEVFSWLPFEVIPNELVKNLFDIDFYYPIVQLDVPEIDEDKIFSACSICEVPSEERQNASIVFAVVDGIIQSADYFSQGKQYARGVFEDGLPVSRSIDNDNDGIFETVEIFGLNKESSLNIDNMENRRLMTNLFGQPEDFSKLYLKMIQIDMNQDTVADFIEEYLEYRGKLSSWDFDGDGLSDLRYKRYPQKDLDSPLIEESVFFMPPAKTAVTVTLWDGKPVKVQGDNFIYNVTKGERSSFYWLDAQGNAYNEKFIMDNFAQTTQQGLCEILENGKDRMLVVKIGENIFVKMLPLSELDEVEFQEGNAD